ncbi:MAG: hypothetical protein QOH97_3015 [Actinoplanes sp.]|nr:hypothetical protein [Actinoplanes sp.]
MVVVAQLVEHRVVVPGVAGSSPVDHPKQFRRSRPWSQLRPWPSLFSGFRICGARGSGAVIIERPAPSQPTVSRPESAQTPAMSAPAALTAATASGSSAAPFAASARA